jgi:hypothetical protein
MAGDGDSKNVEYVTRLVGQVAGLQPVPHDTWEVCESDASRKMRIPDIPGETPAGAAEKSFSVCSGAQS